MRRLPPTPGRGRHRLPPAAPADFGEAPQSASPRRQAADAGQILDAAAPKAMTDNDIKTMFGRKVAIDASMSCVSPRAGRRALLPRPGTID